MFNNLLKVFHDGIIIMEEEQILYSNKKIIRIFNLEKKIQSMNQDQIYSEDDSLNI